MSEIKLSIAEFRERLKRENYHVSICVDKNSHGGQKSEKRSKKEEKCHVYTVPTSLAKEGSQ